MRFTIHSDRATVVLSAIIIVAAGASAHARGQRAAVGPTPAPSVRAVVVPPPNAAGWHNTDVTIMFECVGVVECPQNMVMTTEGAGQRIARSTVDGSGRTVQVEAVVNIDKSVGTVKILQSEQSADSGTDLVSVTAEANDAVSGIAAAYCNGQSARIEGSAIRCEVPIRDGITDLVVSILDRAGNTASAGKEFVRSATSSQVLLFPAAATIELGATRPLYLSDTAWQTLHGRHWMAENPAIAGVDDSTGEVTGLAPGETRIHGWTDDDRTASMTLRVVDGNLPEGTAVWTAHHLAVGTAALPGTSVPMFMELDANGSVSVSAFTWLGEPLWHDFTSIRPGERVHTYGAMFGGPGVHTTMTDGTDAPLTWVDSEAGRSVIVRTGHPSEGAIWRYEIPSAATASWAHAAGTLWAVQQPAHEYPYVDAIDSNTGALKFRVSLPITISAATTNVTETRQLPRPAAVGGAWIGYSGGVNVPYATTEVVRDAVDGEPPRVLARRHVFVLHVTPEGTVSSEALLGFEAPTVDGLPSLVLGETRTEEDDDVLLVLMRVTYRGRPSMGVVMRRSNEGITQYTLPTVGGIVSGEDHYYTADGHTLVAFDPTNGKVRWVHQSVEVFHILYSVRGGGVLIEKPSGRYLVTTDGVEQLKSPRGGPPL